MNMEKKNLYATTALRNCTPDELLLAALLAEVGAVRFGKILDGLLPSMNPTMRHEIVDYTMSPLKAVEELLRDEHGDDQIDGGLGEQFAKLLGDYNLDELEEESPVLFDETGLLHSVLVRNLRAKQVREALDFISDNVSERAALSISLHMGGIAAEHRQMEGQDEYVQYLKARLPVELQGESRIERFDREQYERNEAPVAATPRGNMISMLISLLASAGMDDRSSGDIEAPLDITELLGSMPRRHDVPVNIFDEALMMLERDGGGQVPKFINISDLLGGDRIGDGDPSKGGAATIGDMWVIMNVPFGLPHDITKVMQSEGLADSNVINMDEFRKMPLRGIRPNVMERAFANMDKEGDENVDQVAESRGLKGLKTPKGTYIVTVLKQLYIMARNGIIEHFGSIAKAEKEAEFFLAEHGRLAAMYPTSQVDMQGYILPTTDCDCEPCRFMIEARRRGIFFDGQTGKGKRVHQTGADTKDEQQLTNG